MLDYYECNFSNSLIKSWAEYSLVNFFLYSIQLFTYRALLHVISYKSFWFHSFFTMPNLFSLIVEELVGMGLVIIGVPLTILSGIDTILLSCSVLISIAWLSINNLFNVSSI